MKDGRYYLNKYQYHKDNFRIEDNAYQRRFEELLHDSGRFGLECSVKLEGEQCFADRFNLWYAPAPAAAIVDRFLGLANDINSLEEVTLNFDLFNQVHTPDLYRSDIQQIIAGIDLRTPARDSRLKIWFIVRNNPAYLIRVIHLHGLNDLIPKLMLRQELLFGIDLYFDGRTKLKIYPCLRRSDLQDEETYLRLSGIFSEKIMSLIRLSDMVHISFGGPGSEKVIHFACFHNGADWASRIQSEPFQRINRSLQSNPFRDIQIFSCAESELENDAVTKLNFYY
jgi:LynF/TruF/PatF family peptide O-prenyltransferase